jgi:hypothetical protein
MTSPAPELLEALQKMLATFGDGSCDATDHARAAIRKALGRKDGSA